MAKRSPSNSAIKNSKKYNRNSNSSRSNSNTNNSNKNNKNNNAKKGAIPRKLSQFKPIRLAVEFSI